jgi:hypothetical protein
MKLLEWIYLTPVTWRGWQFSVLKLSLIALGIVLGTVFAEFWRPYLWLVGLVFVVTAVWTGIMYIQGMSKPAGPVTTSETRELPC